MLPSSIDKVDKRPNTNTLPSKRMVWFPREHPTLRLLLAGVETNHSFTISNEGGLWRSARPTAWRILRSRRSVQGSSLGLKSVWCDQREEIEDDSAGTAGQHAKSSGLGSAARRNAPLPLLT